MPRIALRVVCGFSVVIAIFSPKIAFRSVVLLGTKVYLELWVKVKENWRDSDIALSNFGYKE
jgi:hypothetical protein